MTCQKENKCLLITYEMSYDTIPADQAEQNADSSAFSTAVKLVPFCIQQHADKNISRAYRPH